MKSATCSRPKNNSSATLKAAKEAGQTGATTTGPTSNPKAQRKVTDPDSRIMKSKEGFVRSL